MDAVVRNLTQHSNTVTLTGLVGATAAPYTIPGQETEAPPAGGDLEDVLRDRAAEPIKNDLQPVERDTVIARDEALQPANLADIDRDTPFEAVLEDGVPIVGDEYEWQLEDGTRHQILIAEADEVEHNGHHHVIVRGTISPST
ncbi:MAG: hypothetical protein ACOCZK_07785 [Planctomycetota bacterium]